MSDSILFPVRLPTLSRRTLLSGLLGLVLAAGLVLLAIPLVASLGPSARAKDDAQIQIPISKIPEGGAFEFAIRTTRLFITRDGPVRMFAVPYYGREYGFSESTRSSFIWVCRDFRYGDAGFNCADYPEVNQNLHWDRRGRYLGNWELADLQSVPFSLDGDKLLIGPKVE